jgi:hypothetical protein
LFGIGFGLVENEIKKLHLSDMLFGVRDASFFINRSFRIVSNKMLIVFNWQCFRSLFSYKTPTLVNLIAKDW